jgi:hypothetical protein
MLICALEQTVFVTRQVWRGWRAVPRAAKHTLVVSITLAQVGNTVFPVSPTLDIAVVVARRISRDSVVRDSYPAPARRNTVRALCMALQYGLSSKGEAVHVTFFQSCVHFVALARATEDALSVVSAVA